MTDLKQMLEEKPKGRLRAEDLRIGNIVYDPKIDLPIEITWAYLRDLPNLNLQGMIWTEERRLTCGFKKDKDFNHGNYFLKLNEYEYLKCNGGSDYLFFTNNYRIPCKYIHTFQNLIHSLTGTDLKINPETL